MKRMLTLLVATAALLAVPTTAIAGDMSSPAPEVEAPASVEPEAPASVQPEAPVDTSPTADDSASGSVTPTETSDTKNPPCVGDGCGEPKEIKPPAPLPEIKPPAPLPEVEPPPAQAAGGGTRPAALPFTGIGDSSMFIGFLFGILALMGGGMLYRIASLREALAGAGVRDHISGFGAALNRIVRDDAPSHGDRS